MNRRGFLGALIALPAAVLAAPLAWHRQQGAIAYLTAAFNAETRRRGGSSIHAPRAAQVGADLYDAYEADVELYGRWVMTEFRHTPHLAFRRAALFRRDTPGWQIVWIA